MNKKISILSLVPYKIFPAVMGGQKALAVFYTWIGLDTPVTIISTKNNQPPPDSNFRFVPLLQNSVFRYIDPRLFFKVRNHIKKNGYTHFIVEHPYFAWLAYSIKKSLRIPLIVRSYNIESIRFKSTGKWWWGLLWCYERFIHRTADLNFFITEDDMNYAINKFGVLPQKCAVSTYGIETDKIPDAGTLITAKKKLRDMYQISPDTNILLFNGTLDYKPNVDALDAILQQINPLLLQQNDYRYKIIICGKNLPPSYDELKNYATENIIYAGFVKDIFAYFKGADILINPVTSGGGIKTKLVEALASNLSCVSTQSGAIGVPENITGDKVLVSADDDWNALVENILITDRSKNTPPEFFGHFYWGNIAQHAAQLLGTLSKKI